MVARIDYWWAVLAVVTMMFDDCSGDGNGVVVANGGAWAWRDVAPCNGRGGVKLTVMA